jgi:elongation factor P hydroxylase
VRKPTEVTYEQLIEIVNEAYKDGYEAAQKEKDYDPGMTKAWDKVNEILGI